MENSGTRKETAEDLFFKFMDAEDCPEITRTFRRLVKLLEIKTDNPREFYSLLKGKLQSWRCKSLWEQLDSRANHQEYGKGKICEDTQVLIIGAGPIGLRTAIEVALLGAQVVIVEKRESFVRNNVLHLWPFLLTDFRSLGAKKFYGKFCSGSIDHISIRRLQAILLKSALIFGAKLYTGVTFENVIEPNSVEDGWKCKVSPADHPVSSYEFDVLIGADGKKNVIPGFQQIEMRGTLAIGITANFVNHCTEAEANVEEISGIAYQFNPQFFDDLYAQKGIKLENIVYYKDETHYFVMTAGKASLLKRGALKEDLGQPAKLLAPYNIDHSRLLEYVTDVVKYATKGTLKNLELKIVGNNQPDIAAFDFTSIKKAEHAARIIERKGSKLLVGLVGDSLLEPFWPTGSGCARGVLSALDAAWMIRSFAQDRPPLQILSERENIYRLLSGTSAENLHKDHARYTINPSSRYLHITHKKIREVYHLYDTDDSVNADFSLGSPQTAVNNKASRRKRISTGVKFTSSKGRRRGRASSLAAESGASRLKSTSGSSMENLDERKPLDGRLRAQTALSSAGSDDEVFERKTRRVRMNPRERPLTVKGRRSSTVGSSGDELKVKKKKSARKRSLTKENLDNPKDETRKKRGFFGFGKSKAKYKVNEDSDHHSDKESKLFKVKHGEERERPESHPDIVREDSWKGRPEGSFSREQYTRRSTRDIIREMEARSKGEVICNGVANNDKVSGPVLDSKPREKDGGMPRKNNLENSELEGRHKIKKDDEKKKHKEDEKKKKEEERKKKEEEKRRHEEEKKRKEDEEKARKKAEDEIRKREQAKNLHNKNAQTTPANTKSKKQALLDEIAKISPSAKRAMPVLSTLSPELDKENEKGLEHSVTSAVREAAMLLMVTPLLVDGLLPKKLDRTGSWLGRSSGRVRDVVQRYNTLNDMKPLIKPMNGDITPLKRPRDSVDGNEERQCKIKSYEAQDGKENYPEDQNDSCELKPTPTQKRTLQMKKEEKHLISSPSMERLKIKLQDYQDGAPLVDKQTPSTNGKPSIDFNSPIWHKTPLAAMAEIKEKRREEEDSIDDKSTKEKTVPTPANEPVVKDSSATILQKTVISELTDKSDENKEDDQRSLSYSIKDTKATEEELTTTKSSQTSRRASVLPSEQMDEKLANLLNNTSAQKARESIKYMIGLFKQIQRHPNEEKYYRIFKGRVKFRKHVWAVRNAKLFMIASGWTEVGSFIVFPLSKQTEGPLLLLNKYLSIVDEKRLEEKNDERKENLPNIQRTYSSDLAEKIMELKEALVSSRSNSYKTRRLSGGKNSKSVFLHRTVSMDEVNKLRRTGECTSPMKDSRYRGGEIQELHTRLEGEKIKEPVRNLRRSVSENALYSSPQNTNDHTSPFSPISRIFSQREAKEQETSFDLVMENPLALETAAGDKKQTQRSTSSLADEEVADLPMNDTLSAEQYPDRQAVQSPLEAVLEEADQLSSVLGTILDTLGNSTDSERESDSEKKLKQEPEKAKDPEAIADQYKDKELEALCETLDLIIQDNTSESSSESGNDNITNEKPYNLRRRAEASQKGVLKPPEHPTRRTTQQLGKTKSLDAVYQSKNSTMANGRVNRGTKAKSVDVTSLTGNRRSQEGLAAGTRQNISRSVPQNATKRRESSIKTRAQRSSRTSEVLNRKQIGSNKRQSTNGAKPPAVKRPASKAQSVDMDRPRTRQPLVKSKSVGRPKSEITRSSRSSNGEDDKKPQRIKNAERGRSQPARQSFGKGKNRASSATSHKNSGTMSSSEENKSADELEHLKRSREQLAEVGENTDNTEAVPEIKKTSSNHLVAEQNETASYSDNQVAGGKVKVVEVIGQERDSWGAEDVNQENQTLPVNSGNKDQIQENHNEIVELSKEIQSYYAEIPLLPNGDVIESTEGTREGESLEVKRQLSSESELRDFDQESKQPLSVQDKRCNGERDSRNKENGNLNQIEDADIECTQSKTYNRKMTLLDIGKKQSRERSSRKEEAPLSLGERKQRILEAADAKHQSKPAMKRRSILQIKKRNDGNLVKNKKGAFEKPNLAVSTSDNGSVERSPRRRHFRFHGRKRSFELPNEHLDVVPEDNEGDVEENKNGAIPSKEAQDTRLHNGITMEPKIEGEKFGKNVEREKTRSPVKISPFQLRFTKRSGSYDLEKRASIDSVDSPI